MYAFKQTLNLCKDLHSVLLEALSDVQFVCNLDQSQSTTLITLLRELLHQMFLEGDDFIGSYLDECINLCTVFELICTSKHILRKLNIDLLKLLIFDIMSCLINDELESITSTNFQSIHKSGEEIKKLLNTCTLKIFECAKSNSVVLTLIDIINMVCLKLEHDRTKNGNSQTGDKDSQVAIKYNCHFI